MRERGRPGLPCLPCLPCLRWSPPALLPNRCPTADEEEPSGRRQGKKAKKQAAGKRGPEDHETAADVRAQLAALLAEPLQPRFSGKWFTGGAAASVMAAMDPSAPAAGSKKRKKGPAAAAGQQGAQGQQGEAPAVPEPKTVQTVHQVVALAQQRADSRSKAAAAAEAKQQKKGGGGGGSGRGKKGVDPRAAALQAALGKAMSAKQRKKVGGGRNMLVIPQALGRDAVGPDALQTLRQKLGGR